ncbi:MAG: hypothetical protein ACK5QX_00995 [bacterium]
MQKQRKHVKFYEGEVRRWTAKMSVLEAKAKLTESDISDLTQIRKILSLAERGLSLHKRLIQSNERFCQLLATKIDLQRKIAALPKEN